MEHVGQMTLSEPLNLTGKTIVGSPNPSDARRLNLPCDMNKWDLQNHRLFIPPPLPSVESVQVGSNQDDCS